MSHRYIALEGNIGAGKTTMAKKLADRLNARLVLEDFADNPFLVSFYENPGRYAFALEMAFLADRYHQLQHYASEDLFQPITIADYSIYKSLIFAQNNLSGQELVLYRNLFDIIARNLRQPDLVIYFNRPVETLLKHIRQRNRAYEQNIAVTYLEHIHTSYTKFFKQNKKISVVVVNADQYNFLENEQDYFYLEALINQEFQPGLHFTG